MNIDASGWPGWVFSGIVGLVVALLTRGAAVKAALINAQAAPYEAMALRLARLEEEHDNAERDADMLRTRWEVERKSLELAWAHERAQLVASMGSLAHELHQLKAGLGQVPSLIDWIEQGCPPPAPQVRTELRVLVMQLNRPDDIHPRGSE
jgi:hypothetical protein